MNWLSMLINLACRLEEMEDQKREKGKKRSEGKRSENKQKKRGDTDKDWSRG